MTKARATHTGLELALLAEHFRQDVADIACIIDTFNRKLAALGTPLELWLPEWNSGDDSLWLGLGETLVRVPGDSRTWLAAWALGFSELDFPPSVHVDMGNDRIEQDVEPIWSVAVLPVRLYEWRESSQVYDREIIHAGAPRPLSTLPLRLQMRALKLLPELWQAMRAAIEGGVKDIRKARAFVDGLPEAGTLGAVS